MQLRAVSPNVVITLVGGLLTGLLLWQLNALGDSIEGLRADMRAGFGDVRAEIGDLRTEPESTGVVGVCGLSRSSQKQEALFVSGSSRRLDRFATTVDHEGLVANAGLILAGTLMDRLGLLGLIERWVHTGSANPGPKICTVVAAMLAGGTHIDHVGMLRAGRTGRVLGAGPGEAPLVVDVDSTICEVHGKQKQGAAYGYTKALGYHPLLAARADTGEVLGARMRKGSAGSSRGVVRFVGELVANLRRAGAAGPTTVRADSGFWSWKLIDRLDAHDFKWSITVALRSSVRTAIQAIRDDAWADIDYTKGGHAQVAETTYATGRGKAKRTVRLVVRRTRLADSAQQRLWPDWRHHAFITNTELDTAAGQPTATNRTRRTRLVALAAVLVNRSGTPTLRYPARWPWQTQFRAALSALRALPEPSG